MVNPVANWINHLGESKHQPEIRDLPIPNNLHQIACYCFFLGPGGVEFVLYLLLGGLLQKSKTSCFVYHQNGLPTKYNVQKLPKKQHPLLVSLKHIKLQYVLFSCLCSVGNDRVRVLGMNLVIPFKESIGDG